MHIESA